MVILGSAAQQPMVLMNDDVLAEVSRPVFHICDLFSIFKHLICFFFVSMCYSMYVHSSFFDCDVRL